MPSKLLRPLFSVFALMALTAMRGADAPVISPFPDDPSCTAEDRKFMARAFELARLSLARGDSPIGAVLVKDGKIICEFGNTTRTDSDSTMHGETGLIHYASHVLEKSSGRAPRSIRALSRALCARARFIGPG